MARCRRGCSSRSAEETGLIVSMGAWLLGEACREAVTWPAAMRVAVNVSPLQIRLAGFLDTVRGALAQSGLDPHRLELEVTEGILIHDTKETLAVAVPAARDRGAAGDGRFRHRLCQPRLSAEVPLRQDQDRPVVRAESRQRSERRGDRARGGRARATRWASPPTPRGWRTTSRLRCCARLAAARRRDFCTQRRCRGRRCTRCSTRSVRRPDG